MLRFITDFVKPVGAVNVDPNSAVTTEEEKVVAKEDVGDKAGYDEEEIILGPGTTATDMHATIQTVLRKSYLSLHSYASADTASLHFNPLFPISLFIKPSDEKVNVEDSPTTPWHLPHRIRSNNI